MTSDTPEKVIERIRTAIADVAHKDTAFHCGCKDALLGRFISLVLAEIGQYEALTLELDRDDNHADKDYAEYLKRLRFASYSTIMLARKVFL